MKKKIVDIDSIKIPNKIVKTEPSKRKLRMCRKFYQSYGKLDRDIVVNEDMYLVDGYVAYLVLKKFSDVDTVEVCISSEPKKSVEIYVFAKVIKNTLIAENDNEYVYKVMPIDDGGKDIKVGDKIIVDTSGGPELAVVTKVCPNLLLDTLYARYVINSKSVNHR